MKVLIQERKGTEHTGTIPQGSIGAARQHLDAGNAFQITPEEGEPYEVAAELIGSVQQLDAPVLDEDDEAASEE